MVMVMVMVMVIPEWWFLWGKQGKGWQWGRWWAGRRAARPQPPSRPEEEEDSVFQNSNFTWDFRQRGPQQGGSPLTSRRPPPYLFKDFSKCNIRMELVNTKRPIHLQKMHHPTFGWKIQKKTLLWIQILKILAISVSIFFFISTLRFHLDLKLLDYCQLLTFDSRIRGNRFVGSNQWLE